MTSKLIIAVAMLAAAYGEAAAEDARPWTLSTGFSRLFAGDSASGDSNALSLSLSRALGDTAVSVRGGVARRDALFPDTVERSDGDSYAVGGSIEHGFERLTAGLYVDYASESADFTVTPANFPSFAATGETGALSLAAALSGSYGETTRLIPSLSAGWSRTRSTVDAASTIPASLDQRTEGWSGSAGLFAARDLGERWTFSGGAAAIFAEEAGALAITGGGARGPVRRGEFSGLQRPIETGSIVYGEAGLGLSTRLGRVTLSLDAARSFGLDGDYFILSTGTSISF